MRRFGLTPLLILAAIAAAMLVGGRFTPRFPGDLELTRAIQSALPAGDWARAVTRAAYVPWIYGVLAVSALAALRIAGWRAAAAMTVTFFVFMHVEQDIKDFIARPRPSADLVTVAGAPMAMVAAAPAPTAGYSMPSGWGLLFGSTVGVLGMLAWTHTRGVARGTYTIGCAAILVTGLAARVSLGSHWPSDVVAGYLLAIVTGLAIFAALGTLRKGKGKRAEATSRAPSQR
jgi:membrane-associated phospholipid phosphatase